MCGIVGGDMIGVAEAEAALRLLGHRGRDAERLVDRDGVRLGHRRLSIQAPGAGADQPLEFGGGCLLAFNGELWRRTMAGSPAGASDTRLLADLYEGGGVDPEAWARGLDGMFAAAVLDRPRGRLVLARDWLGRVPLYYALGRGGGIAFASEAKALTEVLGLRFAGSGPRDQRHSEVRLFPAGCVGVYGLAERRLEVRRFRGWEEYRGPVADLDASDLGPEHYAEGIRARLRAAVANESISDVPVCTILSGGVDSTVVTALLREVVPNLRAYTVSVGESDGRDDLACARRAAAEVGVPLTEVVLEPAEVLAGLEEVVWAVEDHRWVQVAPAAPQIALARRIGADGYRVVFGGEGSDELFGSYGDVRRWSWLPHQYHARRVDLCERLGDNNLIRGNKAMMWGGTIELRTPFLDRELVDFCLRIPTRYRANRDGAGRVLKPLLREAFRGTVSDGLLMRKKVTFQEGAHSDFLKWHRDAMRAVFDDLFDGRRTCPT